jgi:hypothetical protein
VDAELQEYHKVNAELDATIGALRGELDELHKEATGARATLADRTAAVDRVLADLLGLSRIILEPAKLRAAVAALHARHVPASLELPRISAAVVDEYERQRVALEASATEMHALFLAEQAAGAAESRRIVEASRGLIAEIQGLRDRVAKLKAARQDLKGAPTPPPALPVGAMVAVASAEEPSADLLRLLEGRKAEIASLRRDIDALEQALLHASAPASRIRPLRL